MSITIEVERTIRFKIRVHTRYDVASPGEGEWTARRVAVEDPIALHWAALQSVTIDDPEVEAAVEELQAESRA